MVKKTAKLLLRVAKRAIVFLRRMTLKTDLDLAMSVEGQISHSEARSLMGLAKSMPADAVIIEIGSYRGRSTIALALGARKGYNNRVYAVDPHSEFTGVFGAEFGPQDQAALYRSLTASNVGDIVAVVALPSISAAKGWNDRNVGLLFIDGDHRYKSVRSDFEVWVPFIIEEGVVAFHDNSAPGVNRLIQELVSAGVIVPLGEVESLSWFRIAKEAIKGETCVTV